MKAFRAPRLMKILFLAMALAALWRVARADDAGDLKAAFAAMRAGNYAAALATAGPQGSLGWDLVEWHRLRAGQGTFDEYRAFVARRGDWPGMPYLMRFGESAIPPGYDAAAVVNWFDIEQPQTGQGAMRAIEAHLARGEKADAEALAVLAWRSLPLAPLDEALLAATFGSLLASHDIPRLDSLLWQGRTQEAERMLTRASEAWQKLARARIALRQDRDGVDALIAAVPAELSDHPGLAYERFLWRKRKGREDAVALMDERSASAAGLGEVGRWSTDRRAMARSLMRAGKAAEAYRLASRHHLPEFHGDYADLEWLSGFIALRYLGDPGRALEHFVRFRLAVRTPISLGRAGYWEGRALEAMGHPVDAQAAYEFGAEFQTSFYGLLAAEKAGLPMDPSLLGVERYPDWRQAAFLRSSVMQAAMLLYRAGELDLAERFMRHLGESLDATQLGQIADLALDLDEPHLALSIAKFAADQGVVLNRAYYPLHAIAKAKLPVPAELALAIARRESEFDPRVVSPAGAMGLMQLMPNTAREMATTLGLPYDPARLLSDPDYNAELGTGYLAKLIAEFGSNPMLVAAAYNAGPTRARRWIADLGDPRAGAVDPVDWIEHIPFEETRTYIMRVTESLPIYRARLSGETGPVGLSAELVAR